MTFTFRNAGPSGRGTGRIRYYVDIDGGDCIGSVEGKTGDYRLDFDYATDGVHNGAQSFHTRMDAARALADGAAKAAKPPVSAEEYRLLQRARRGEVFAMPVLGFARILCSRGLLAQKRGTFQFRTTSEGLAVLARYEQWVATRNAPEGNRGSQ